MNYYLVNGNSVSTISKSSFSDFVDYMFNEFLYNKPSAIEMTDSQIKELIEENEYNVIDVGGDVWTYADDNSYSFIKEALSDYINNSATEDEIDSILNKIIG